ncbi:MAG: hypothetical protein WC119_01270 [Synergistaceae bacterium]
MKSKIKQLKEELKSLAKRIRQEKIALKEYQRNHGGSHGTIGVNLSRIQREYRHKHIAYCLLRGRTIEQIEGKNRKGNEPDTNLIQKYCELYRTEEIAA